MNRSQAILAGNSTTFYARVLPSRTKPTGHGNARPDQLSTLPLPAPALPLPLPPDDANLLNYRNSKATLTVFRFGRRLCLCYVHYLVLRVITVLSWRKSRSRYRILCFLEMKYLSQTWLTWVSNILFHVGYSTSLRPEQLKANDTLCFELCSGLIVVVERDIS